MNIHKKEKGFTIIEVVLVLAIAGLIFLMVFIALPALQRSQRDTQRKDDLSRVITAIASYSSINRNALPAFNDSFVSQYLTPTESDTFIDPSGKNTAQLASTTTYQFVSSATTPLAGKFDASSTQNVIYYSSGYTCGATGDSIVAAGNRKVALRMYLEGGGVNCMSN